MNDMKLRVKKFLAPMVTGGFPETFNPAMQLALANWALKTVLVLDHQDPRHECKRASRAFDSLDDHPLISQQMQYVGAQPEFWEALSHCAITPSTQDHLRDIALRLFATTGDFTSLHAVAGLEALARIRRLVDDTVAFDQASLISVAAAYASGQTPTVALVDHLTHVTTSGVLALDEIKSVGTVNDDEHISKLIYSSFGLHAKTGDDLYLAVASRKARADSSV